MRVDALALRRDGGSPYVGVRRNAAGGVGGISELGLSSASARSRASRQIASSFSRSMVLVSRSDSQSASSSLNCSKSVLVVLTSNGCPELGTQDRWPAWDVPAGRRSGGGPPGRPARAGSSDAAPAASGDAAGWRVSRIRGRGCNGRRPRARSALGRTVTPMTPMTVLEHIYDLSKRGSGLDLGVFGRTPGWQMPALTAVRPAPPAPAGPVAPDRRLGPRTCR